MKNKIIGIVVCTLLITTTFIPVINAGGENIRTQPVQYNEFENKIEKLGNKLYYTKSENEKAAILKDIAILYDEYGLLPEDMTVEEAEQLMIDSYSSRFYSSRNPSQKQNYYPGELIIKFTKDTEVTISSSPKGFITTGIPSIDALNEKYGVTYFKKTFGEFSIPDLSSIYRFVFSDDIDIYCIMKEYCLNPSVEYAEPNYIARTCMVSTTIRSDLTKKLSSPVNSGERVLIPDDPLFDQQWALNQSNDCDIDAPEAWQIETGNDSVVIAMIDTGVDYNHEDLAGNIWNNTDEIPDNGIDDDDNGFIDDTCGWDFSDNDNDPMDDDGHGTLCSGIASAVTNNGIGIAGVSWDSQIMPLDIFNSEGLAYLDDLANAIYYAVDNDANIISMSCGIYISSRLLLDAVNYAYDQGVVLVASAGNDDTDTLLYPSAYDNVISVAATDNVDNKAGFSNYGDWVDVAAPGVDILSTTLGNQYKYASGTSTSCPFVAGLAALLLSKHIQCPYIAQMIKSVITYATDEIETDKYIGTGRINAYKALTMEPFAVDLEVIPNWEDVKGTIDIKGVAWGENLRYFVLEAGEGEHPSSWMVLFNSSTPQGGVLLSLNTASLDEGLYTLRLRVVYTDDFYSDEILMYINNEADGTYDADIYISTCFDSTTPGWGVDRFDKIQDGIDKAKSGDTVFVYDGFYQEDIKITGSLKSSISLIGQNNKWTIIEGCINISNAKKVTVSGFTIRGGYGIIGPYEERYYEVGAFYSPQCTIADNNIIDYYMVNNILTDHSNNMIIRGNTFTKTYYSKIGETWFSSIFHGYSSKGEISDNTLIGPGGFIVVFVGRSNIIYNNTVLRENIGCIWLVLQFNSLIYKNTLNTDFLGFTGIIIILGCFRNIIVANSINAPSAIDIQFFQCGNHFYLNNFIVPIYDGGPGLTYDAGINYWYKSEGLFHGKGNYWNYYKEWYNWEYGENPTDENNDGFWDKPYLVNTPEVLGIFNKDRFPFVKPIDLQNITVPEAEEFISQIENEFNSEIIELEINSQCDQQFSSSLISQTQSIELLQQMVKINK